jgi:hypothetical protein
LPPFFLFALAFGGILVPKLNLIKSLVCREYFIEQSRLDPSFVLTPVLFGDDNPQCEIPAVQKLVTRFMLYISIITGGLGAVVSPKLGALSDRYGRLPILAITSMGGFLTEIVTILAATYPESVSYQWLLAGAVVDGLCGSFTAGAAVVHAYSADCTAPPRRNVVFGYLHACLFSGIAFGPLLAAFLLKNGGTLISIFYIALGIHIFFMFYIIFVAPESLSKKKQIFARERHTEEGALILEESRSHPTYFMGQDLKVAKTMLKHANILAPLKILWPTGPGTSNSLRANLILLSAVDTIMFGVGHGAMTVTVYYLGFQFHWTTATSSEFVSIVNIVRVAALVIVLPCLNYLVRTRRANRQRRESGFAIPEPNSGSDNLDLYTVRAAVLFELVGYGGYALVRSGGLFTLFAVFAAVGSIGSPTMQSALTKHVPHDRVGQLLGATGLLHALARVVAPTVFNVIYEKTVGNFTQTIFVVLFGIFVVAFFLSWFIRPHGKLSNLRPRTSILTSAVYLEETGTTTANSERTANNIDPDVLVDEEIVGA